jgi:hypothetical protein
MDSLLPTPPAVCYNSLNNTYYLRYRGSFAGTLDPDMVGTEDPELRGVLKDRDADFWSPISFEKWLYTVKNKTELDQLIVAPPAVAFRKDTHRYYYRVGPEGYGGRTGLKQRLDINGQPMWDSGPAITGTIVVPGPNTWNTLYTNMSSTVIVAGIFFTIEGAIDPDTLLPITFQITQIIPVGGGLYTWSYLPEYDSTTVVGNKITTQTSPVLQGVVKPAPTPPSTDICYVSNLTGIVLPNHEFYVSTTGQTKYTVVEIDDSKWTFFDAAPQFPNGSTITMVHPGNPQMEIRDPDAWILNSHLYEDNTQGFI